MRGEKSNIRSRFWSEKGREVRTLLVEYKMLLMHEYVYDTRLSYASIRSLCINTISWGALTNNLSNSCKFLFQRKIRYHPSISNVGITLGKHDSNRLEVGYVYIKEDGKRRKRRGKKKREWKEGNHRACAKAGLEHATVTTVCLGAYNSDLRCALEHVLQ